MHVLVYVVTYTCTVQAGTFELMGYVAEKNPWHHLEKTQ